MSWEVKFPDLWLVALEKSLHFLDWNGMNGQDGFMECFTIECEHEYQRWDSLWYRHYLPWLCVCVRMCFNHQINIRSLFFVTRLYTKHAHVLYHIFYKSLICLSFLRTDLLKICIHILIHTYSDLWGLCHSSENIYLGLLRFSSNCQRFWQTTFTM